MSTINGQTSADLRWANGGGAWRWEFKDDTGGWAALSSDHLLADAFATNPSQVTLTLTNNLTYSVDFTIAGDTKTCVGNGGSQSWRLTVNAPCPAEFAISPDQPPIVGEDFPTDPTFKVTWAGGAGAC